MREAVLRPRQGLGIALGEPSLVVAAAVVPVRAHQRDLIEAVERGLDSRILVGPVFRRLLLVRRIIEIVAQRLNQIGRILRIDQRRLNQSLLDYVHCRTVADQNR